MSDVAQYRGTGKRKTSVARVILKPGDGTWWINGRTLDDYFKRTIHRVQVVSPLKVAEAEGTYDVRVRVHGGGPDRPGRRRSPRRRPRARRGRSRAPRAAEARGLPRPRRAHGRAQESGLEEGSQSAPVG